MKSGRPRPKRPAFVPDPVALAQLREMFPTEQERTLFAALSLGKNDVGIAVDFVFETLGTRGEQDTPWVEREEKAPGKGTPAGVTPVSGSPPLPLPLSSSSSSSSSLGASSRMEPAATQTEGGGGSSAAEACSTPSTCQEALAPATSASSPAAATAAAAAPGPVPTSVPSEIPHEIVVGGSSSSTAALSISLPPSVSNVSPGEQEEAGQPADEPGQVEVRAGVLEKEAGRTGDKEEVAVALPEVVVGVSDLDCGAATGEAAASAAADAAVEIAAGAAGGAEDGGSTADVGRAEVSAAAGAGEVVEGVGASAAGACSAAAAYGGEVDEFTHVDSDGSLEDGKEVGEELEEMVVVDEEEAVVEVEDVVEEDVVVEKQEEEREKAEEEEDDEKLGWSTLSATPLGSQLDLSNFDKGGFESLLARSADMKGELEEGIREVEQLGGTLAVAHRQAAQAERQLEEVREAEERDSARMRSTILQAREALDSRAAEADGEKALLQLEARDVLSRLASVREAKRKVQAEIAKLKAELHALAEEAKSRQKHAQKQLMGLQAGRERREREECEEMCALAERKKKLEKEEVDCAELHAFLTKGNQQVDAIEGGIMKCSEDVENLRKRFLSVPFLAASFTDGLHDLALPVPSAWATTSTSEHGSHMAQQGGSSGAVNFAVAGGAESMTGSSTSVRSAMRQQMGDVMPPSEDGSSYGTGTNSLAGSKCFVRDGEGETAVAAGVEAGGPEDFSDMKNVEEVEQESPRAEVDAWQSWSAGAAAAGQPGGNMAPGTLSAGSAHDGNNHAHGLHAEFEAAIRRAAQADSAFVAPVHVYEGTTSTDGAGSGSPLISGLAVVDDEWVNV